LTQLAILARRTRLGLFAALLVVTLSGCKHLRGALLWAPETFGLVRVSDNLYIEEGADEPTRALLQEAMARAEKAFQAAYGEVLSHPVIHACLSDECLYRFGAHGTFGKAYGNHLLLSRRGMNWHPTRPKIVTTASVPLLPRVIRRALPLKSPR